MAREKKQFDENSGLGFMRVIQFASVAFILFFMTSLILVKGSSVSLMNVGAITVIFQICAMTMSVYVIQRRLLYARQIVIGLLVAAIVLNTLFYLVRGEFDVVKIVSGSFVEVLLIIYFATSRRAKAVLVRPYNDNTLAEQQAAKNAEMWDPKSVDFWLRLILYFFVFSIVGHWMEMGVQILVINGLFPGTVAGADSLTWRDHWNPFFIYGIAVAIAGLVLYPIYIALRKRIKPKALAFLLSFLVNTVFCVLAELILGFLFNADHHAWNYSDMFLNFEGQICLVYSLAFGVMSSIITWGLYPLMERQFGRIKRERFRLIFVIALVLFIMVYLTYNVDLDTLMPGNDLSVTQAEIDSSVS